MLLSTKFNARSKQVRASFACKLALVTTSSVPNSRLELGSHENLTLGLHLSFERREKTKMKSVILLIICANVFFFNKIWLHILQKKWAVRLV